MSNRRIYPHTDGTKFDRLTQAGNAIFRLTRHHGLTPSESATVLIGTLAMLIISTADDDAQIGLAIEGAKSALDDYHQEYLKDGGPFMGARRR